MKSLSEKLEDGYIPVSETGCFLWIAGVNRHGYGLVYHSNKKYLAHRVSYELMMGEIPEGKFVCHKCDVRCCVNPDHLFVGSAQENSSDMVAKGRYKRGKIKLDMNKATEIRRSNLTIPQLSEKYGVTEQCIVAVLVNKTWVDSPERYKHKNMRSRPTECKHGHPLTGLNLKITKQGWMQCRECITRRSRESYLRRK